LRLIEFVRTYLDGFGIAATRIPGAGRDEGEPVVGPIGKRGIGLYATEAGLFEEAGCPTVICGPGDIEQAHAADEFVTTAQLDACTAVLAKLAELLS